MELDKALKSSEEKIEQLKKEIETLSRVLSTTSSYTPPPRTPVYVNLDEKSPIKVLKKPLNVPPPPPSKNTTPLVSPLSKLSSISEKSTIKIATKDESKKRSDPEIAVDKKSASQLDVSQDELVIIHSVNEDEIIIRDTAENQDVAIDIEDISGSNKDISASNKDLDEATADKEFSAEKKI